MKQQYYKYENMETHKWNMKHSKMKRKLRNYHNDNETLTILDNTKREHEHINENSNL